MYMYKATNALSLVHVCVLVFLPPQLAHDLNLSIFKGLLWSHNGIDFQSQLKLAVKYIHALQNHFEHAFIKTTINLLIKPCTLLRQLL